MTTVNTTRQVTHSTVSGGGDWDHRLNRLLEDLQGTVAPTSDSGSATSGSEYREYRMSSSSRTNDEPAVTTNEKWIEYGSRGGAGGPSTLPATLQTNQRLLGASSQPLHSSNTSSKYSSSSTTEKTVGFKPGPSHVEYLTPANLTTELRSGSTSPAPAPMQLTSSSTITSGSPKVERKEFYAKASYTTLVKGGPDGTTFEDQIIPTRPGLTSSTTESREYMTSGGRSYGGGQPPQPAAIAPTPLYSSTPVKQSVQSSSYSSSSSTARDMIHSHPARSVTPPPKPADGLKTPPLIRKIMQQSSTSQTTKETSISRPPVAATPIWDEPPTRPAGPSGGSSTQYYTSTTTRAETRERDLSPVRKFPSSSPAMNGGGPPKHLDELLSTFDESYTSTSRIAGDGGGPHGSHPYGPGTSHVRQVRIDESGTGRSRNVMDSEAELVQKQQRQPVQETRNISGPPVYYPPSSGREIVGSGEAGAMEITERGRGKGKAKMKMDRSYKMKEKSKSSHGEKGGEGALPVPVCLPVCCAAPCSIV